MSNLADRVFTVVRGVSLTWPAFSSCDPETVLRACGIRHPTEQRLCRHRLSLPVSTYGQHLQGQPEYSAYPRPILRNFYIPCRSTSPPGRSWASRLGRRRLLIWCVALGTDDLFSPEVVIFDAATGTGPLFPQFCFAHRSSSWDCDLRPLAHHNDQP